MKGLVSKQGPNHGLLSMSRKVFTYGSHWKNFTVNYLDQLDGKLFTRSISGHYRQHARISIEESVPLAIPPLLRGPSGAEGSRANMQF